MKNTVVTVGKVMLVMRRGVQEIICLLPVRKESLCLFTLAQTVDGPS